VRRKLVFVEDKDGSGDGGGPEAALVADRGLGDVAGAHDFVGDAIDLLLFVPALVGVEVDVERGGEHFSGEFFSVFAGLVLGFAEAVMLAEVTVGVLVSGDGDADAGDDEAMRFARGIFRDDGEDDFAVVEEVCAFLAGDDLAARRIDG